jgi:hypothetical protein
MLHRFSYFGTGGQWLGEERLLRDTAGNLYGTSQAGHSGTGWGRFLSWIQPGTSPCCILFPVALAGAIPGRESFPIQPGTSTAPLPKAAAALVWALAAERFTSWPQTENLPSCIGSRAESGDGGVPWAALVMDRAGNLYGTTELGGLRDGIVFKIRL